MSLFIFVVVFWGWEWVNAIDGRYGVFTVHILANHIVDIFVGEVFEDDIEHPTDNSISRPVFMALYKFVDGLHTIGLQSNA